ncbi:MAG: NIPSNAP family protein [Burkholderiales bacterium]|nr:NIPSNAP family protein [Burkholderiales bacterium]
MLYEIRTYDIKPKSLGEVEKRFGEAYEQRKKLSPLAAFFHTEIGPLNQIIHIWPYKDMAERERIRGEAVASGNWPPKIGEFVLNMRTEIYIPFSFSPQITPGKLGPYFEMRTYTFAPGELPKIQKVWEKALPTRTKISPLVAVMYAEVGAVNRFTHIWAYPTLDARNETREKAAATGVWPPSAYAKKEGLPDALLVSQENKIVMPSAFSPLQ